MARRFERNSRSRRLKANPTETVELLRYRKHMLRALFCVLLALAAMRATAAAPEKMTREAMQLLKAECVSCHNPEKKKGGLILTTRDALLKGGDDGAVLLP